MSLQKSLINLVMARQWMYGQRGTHAFSFLDITFSHPQTHVSIITYVLLCGYSPFRSEEPADLVRETAEANIKFHDRFWRNISEPAKDFIRSLLKPNPVDRPTVSQALKDPWLTEHEASTEHDLTGLRENFNPKVRWRSAIQGAIAMNRFSRKGSDQSASESLGWRTPGSSALTPTNGNKKLNFGTHTSDEDSGMEGDVGPSSRKGTAEQVVNGGEHNENVKVHAPPEDHDQEAKEVSEAPAFSSSSGAQAAEEPDVGQGLKREHDLPQPAVHQAPVPHPDEVKAQTSGVTNTEPGKSSSPDQTEKVDGQNEVGHEEESHGHGEDGESEEMSIPGSFDLPRRAGAHRHQEPMRPWPGIHALMGALRSFRLGSR